MGIEKFPKKRRANKLWTKHEVWHCGGCDGTSFELHKFRDRHALFCLSCESYSKNIRLVFLEPVNTEKEK